MIHQRKKQTINSQPLTIKDIDNFFKPRYEDITPNLFYIRDFIKFRRTVSSKRENLLCQWKSIKPNTQELMRIPIIKTPILSKGDRVILTGVCSGFLGPGSEGIVMKNIYDSYATVPVDFVRVHNLRGSKSTNPWNYGHDCEGVIPKRNNRYYGYWISCLNLKIIDKVSDEDILLLI